MTSEDHADRYRDNIARSGLTIYDPITVGDPELWIPSPELEALLDHGLHGLTVEGLPLRTRSKLVKTAVCGVLGYPAPKTFKKTQPRFPGQNFDTYVQKANNLQVWNEELSPTRRYVLIRPSESGTVERVKVVTGESLALLDTTGTLTQKYQARVVLGGAPTELVTPADTTNLAPILRSSEWPARMPEEPTDHPDQRTLLPIVELYRRLVSIVGRKVPDVGSDQERNRGAGLHRLACEVLGYASHKDDGQLPDMRNQLLEMKLQTSPTIDLGLFRPDDLEPIDTPMLGGRQIRHCDLRYAVAYGVTDGPNVIVTHLFLTTGEGFLERFVLFQGKVLNKKQQIHLPRDFFNR